MTRSNYNETEKENEVKKISVIVPIYNVEKYLEKCINSITNQTYENLEIILVDDGSPDRCGEMCDEYSKRDKRIKVIHKENGGLSDARNAGIEAATGDYIAFVDSDDYIREDMYEKLYKALKNNNADMSICNFKYVSDDGSDQFDNDNLPIKDEILSGMFILNEQMKKTKCWYWVVAWNKLYKRELFSGIRYPVGKIHEDEFIIHRLLLKCQNVACVSDMLYYYVQREGSIISSKYNYRRLDEVEALYNRMEFYIDNRLSSKMLINIFNFSRVSLYKSYLVAPKKNPEFEQCYKRLNKQYRRIFKKLVKCDIGIKSKLVMIGHYISPYLTWKISSIIKLNAFKKNNESI